MYYFAEFQAELAAQAIDTPETSPRVSLRALHPYFLSLLAFCLAR